MPQLRFALADFQVVHPTEMETFTTEHNTGTFDEHAKPVINRITQERRKRLPVDGVAITIKSVNSQGNPIELAFETDATGRALCAVGQGDLSQLPVEAEFEVRTPKGHHQRGKVRCGGNEPSKVTELVLQGPKMPEKHEKSVILTPEKRFLTHEIAEIRVKKSENGGKTLVGYAAKFDRLSQDLGGFVEKIDKKAFQKCLKRCDVRGLKNHDPAMLLGRTKSGTMRLESDEEGLKYEIDVPDTQTGRDLITEIERGDIDGSSFSFTMDPDGDEWDDSTDPPTRTLDGIRDLFDVGPVTYPAYLDTEASIRSFRSHLESLAHRRRREEEGRNREKDKKIRILKMRLGQLIS